MISATFPEPIFDVVGQIYALLDPGHPKDAVWLARGTASPGAIAGVERIAVAEGVLFTADQEKACHFARHPDDEALAEVLGYIVPKSQIVGPAAVVRAIDGEGRVITEMVCGIPDIGRALTALRGHGRPEVTTIESALMRRVGLL